MTSNVFDTGVHELLRNWGWLLALGIVLIFLGVIALIHSVAVSLISVIFFGWVLIFAGIVEAVQAFRHWNGSHFFLHVLDAVFSFIVSIMLLRSSLAGLLVMTLLLAMYFIVAGATALQQFHQCIQRPAAEAKPT